MKQIEAGLQISLLHIMQRRGLWDGIYKCLINNTSFSRTPRRQLLHALNWMRMGFWVLVPLRQGVLLLLLLLLLLRSEVSLVAVRLPDYCLPDGVCFEVFRIWL
jgi:hypothetical protein